MSATDEPIWRGLRALGLNEYESRAYLGLLESGPATAYELGRATGIPLSRCYEIARALVTKSLAMVAPGETPRYLALALSDAIARQRQLVAADLAALDRTLAPHLSRLAATVDSGTWVLDGERAVRAGLASIIDRAESELAGIVPRPIADLYRDDFGHARSRGVRVSLRPGGDALVVVRDGAEALLADVRDDRILAASLLRDPGVVRLLRGMLDGRDATDTGPDPMLDPGWLDWEAVKVRRLLASVPALQSLDG
jgi:sugar-specific transcriptional regulator TrmB